MNLKEFMKKYESLKEFQIFKEKFPEMYEFSKYVEVIPWQDDFAIADKNPEVLEELEFYETLYQNGMIDEKEYERLREKVWKKTSGIVSKTMGIAFTDDNVVSFRSQRPPFWVVVHELGHCYFKEPDPVWSSVYGGGESVLWLIVKGHLEGNEETVRRYMDFLKLTYENPKKANEVLNEVARKLLEDKGVKNFAGFCLYSGYVPMGVKTVNYEEAPDYLSKEALLMGVVNMIEGIRWNDPFWERFAKEFLK